MDNTDIDNTHLQFGHRQSTDIDKTDISVKADKIGPYVDQKLSGPDVDQKWI